MQEVTGSSPVSPTNSPSYAQIRALLAFLLPMQRWHHGNTPLACACCVVLTVLAIALSACETHPTPSPRREAPTPFAEQGTEEQPGGAP